MIKYDLTLEKQRLIGADKFSIAANANETVCLCFHFDRSWRRFDSKAAVFRNNVSEYYIIEIISDRAKVPWEVLTHQGEFELSVIGFENEKVITSDKVEILVSESLLPEDCKTFSPSEVLFDRFKRECIAQAYLDYEDEINELKKAHTIEKMNLNAQIIEANERTDDIEKAKNQEITQINIIHQKQTEQLNRQITELSQTVEEYKEKAYNWDLIDKAIGMKTSASTALWQGGREKYSLPMLNTSSISNFSVTGFSTNLTEIGLDLSSVKTFSGIFASAQSITRVELKNGHNVSSYANLFENCKTIKHITIGNISNCSNLSCFANEATSLQTVTFSGNVEASLLEKAFSNCLVLREINGLFDLQYATNLNMMFQNCSSLKEVRFVEDTINMSIDFGSCVSLSKESLISIFKGLKTGIGDLLTIPSYTFETQFTPEEREEWTSYIYDVKEWEFVLN